MKTYDNVIPGPFVQSSVRGYAPGPMAAGNEMLSLMGLPQTSVRGMGGLNVPPNTEGQTGFGSDYWYSPNNPSDGDGCEPYPSPEAAAMHWSQGGGGVNKNAHMGAATMAEMMQISPDIAEAEAVFDNKRAQITNLSASPVSNMHELGMQAMEFGALAGLPVSAAASLANMPAPIAAPLGTPASQDQALYLLQQAAPPPVAYAPPSYLQRQGPLGVPNIPGPNLEGQTGFPATYWYGPNNPSEGAGCVPYASPEDAALHWNGQGPRPVLVPPSPPAPPAPPPVQPPIYVTELPETPNGEIPVRQVPPPMIQQILDEQQPPRIFPIRPIEMGTKLPMLTEDAFAIHEQQMPMLTEDAFAIHEQQMPMLTEDAFAIHEQQMPMLTPEAIQIYGQLQQQQEQAMPLLTSDAMRMIADAKAQAQAESDMQIASEYAQNTVEPLPMLSARTMQIMAGASRPTIRGIYTYRNHPRG